MRHAPRPTPHPAPPETDEPDIYQRIWDADQAHAGIRALAVGSPTEAWEAHGYVMVDERYRGGRDHRLLDGLHLPDRKRPSYDAVRGVMDGYAADVRVPDRLSLDEQRRVLEYVGMVEDTPPLRVAREYIGQRTGRRLGADAWNALLHGAWFAQYRMGRDADQSGFEHVFLGEADGAELKGYHFWYRYWLDERVERPGGVRDLIDVLGGAIRPGDVTPDVVTLRYRWADRSADGGKPRWFTKPLGGFWVGPSPEGLLALGLVRWAREANPPRTARINGVQYHLVLHTSDDGRHIRTFFPSFVRMVPAPPIAQG
jgi:poly(U)-specific endoribonuclease